MFIGHFALTPEPLVRLSWNFVLRNLYTRGRSSANFSPIRPKNVCHREDRPLCKWPFAKERRSTKEDGSSRWSFATIHAPPSLWFYHLMNSPLCKQPFVKERRRPDHLDDHLQNCSSLDFGHPEDKPLCKWLIVKKRRNNCCEEHFSRGTIVERNNCRVEQLSRGIIVPREHVLRDIERHW